MRTAPTAWCCRNFKVELSDFNNIYVLETNGFRIDRRRSGYSREYGILSFTSDHGIYENCETYGNGDWACTRARVPTVTGFRTRTVTCTGS